MGRWQRKNRPPTDELYSVLLQPFPTKIFKEDREEYISALWRSQEEETNQPFLDFMAGQLKKSLSLEIERFKTSQKKIFSFMF